MDISLLITEIETLKVELEKFEHGNKAAGTRARKSCQNIKKIAHDIRGKIQEQKLQSIQN